MFGTVHGALAAPGDEAAALPDRVLGSPDAPVTIIEYASLTCPHCAEFYVKTMDKLKADYIDTGKVRFIFRDYPLDGVSLRVAALARCMPENSYHPYISMLFKNQEKWRTGYDADAMVKAAAQYAKLGGLNESDAIACSKNEKLLDAITAKRMTATTTYTVQATPTFIFNEGVIKFAGARSYEEFVSAIGTLMLPQNAKKK